MNSLAENVSSLNGIYKQSIVQNFPLTIRKLQQYPKINDNYARLARALEPLFDILNIAFRQSINSDNLSN